MRVRQLVVRHMINFKDSSLRCIDVNRWQGGIDQLKLAPKDRVHGVRNYLPDRGWLRFMWTGS